jgi:hypothetical protein
VVNADESTDEEESAKEEITPMRFRNSPCAMVVVNQRKYSDKIYQVVEKLRSDRLSIDLHLSRDDSFLPSIEVGSNKVADVKKIERMKLCNPALF